MNVNLCNKSRFKKCNRSYFAKKTNLDNLKSDVDKLDIGELKNVRSNLSNLKSKVDKLNTGKLKTAPVDLSKLSNCSKKLCY